MAHRVTLNVTAPDSLEGREKMREKWLQDVFDEADADRKGMLDELETIALLKRLNERLCIRSLKQKIVEFEMSKKNGEQRGCISKHAFISLFTQTATRPDVYFILLRYCGRDYMTAEEFQLFLEGEQGVIGTSLKSCEELIRRFEPSDEARNQRKMLIDGFTQFLLSEACDIVGNAPRQISHDMNQPFAHYYIASSYNTYLIEDQVKGPSSCDGYIQAMQSGCRLVKIDVHDGPEGTAPLVYHGNTLTTKIPLSEVLVTIRDYAFLKSPYPVIIHLENHCSVAVQKEVARMMQEILGDHLFMVPDADSALSSNELLDNNESPEQIKSKSPSVSSNSSDEQDGFFASQISIDTASSMSSDASKRVSDSAGIAPSGKALDLARSHTSFHIWQQITPAELKNKIIISGKKITRKDAMVEEISDEEEESQDNRDRVNGRKKILLCRELSQLVSLVRVSGSTLDSNQLANNANLVHLSESSAIKLALGATDELTQRNKLGLTQVTPDVSRIDSSNLNPLDFLNCGVQMISMNYQSHGQLLNLYKGWFSQNGSCGYVLKPPFLREKYSTFNPRRKDVMPGVDPMNIRIKIISGQQLPRPKGASLKASSIDPYVTVQCVGVPIDCAEARTRTVSNDGHDPIFDESFEFNVCVPELAMIRFLVLDDDFINDDFIGQLTVPVSSLNPGFKHIRLQNMSGEIVPNASLFVKISITHRYGSKQKLRRKRSWTQKHSYDTKQVGIKNIDEQMKSIFNVIHEAVQMRKSVEKLILDLCDECSLPESANMAQCLRIITLRMASCPTVITCKVTLSESGYPSLRVTGELTPKLTRTLAALDRALHEFHVSTTQSQAYINTLSETYRQFSHINYEYRPPTKENSNLLSNIIENIRSSSPKFYKEKESSESSCGSHGETRDSVGSAEQANERNGHICQERTSTSNSPIGSFKASRKNEKVMENLFWNLSVIKCELDNLYTLRNDCNNAFQQIERIACSLEHIFEREHKMTLRSNSYVVRELSNVNNYMSHQSMGVVREECEVNKQSVLPAPLVASTGGGTDGQLRGILKKSVSPTSMLSGNGTAHIETNSHLTSHSEHSDLNSSHIPDTSTHRC